MSITYLHIPVAVIRKMLSLRVEVITFCISNLSFFLADLNACYITFLFPSILSNIVTIVLFPWISLMPLPFKIPLYLHDFVRSVVFLVVNNPFLLFWLLVTGVFLDL